MFKEFLRSREIKDYVPYMEVLQDADLENKWVAVGKNGYVMGETIEELVGEVLGRDLEQILVGYIPAKERDQSRVRDTLYAMLDEYVTFGGRITGKPLVRESLMNQWVVISNGVVASGKELKETLACSQLLTAVSAGIMCHSVASYIHEFSDSDGGYNFEDLECA